MLPERQAIGAMRRAFEMGINWVHTAPDYGGVEHWIARAIRESGEDVTVATQCPAHVTLLEPFFENTRTIFRRDTLDLYGVNCIEDIEYIGENVWGPGGTIDLLQRKKREGQVRALFCTTHGPIDYMERLVTCGVFDAVMVAYNPLEFHLLTYYAAKIGRRFESLRDIRERLFPLAAAHGVSVIVMKPLAAGLLTRGLAFPPAAWPGDRQSLDPADLLRYALAHPGVCAVVPGIASIEEAEQDARAGYAPLTLPPARTVAIEAAAAEMRLSLCSRCGECEATCSRGLPISSMFRDAYIWSYGNETFMADDRENYFALHPADALACASCDNQTCLCPQGLEVPRALAEVHDTVRALRASGRHPGPIESARPAARSHRAPRAARQPRGALGPRGAPSVAPLPGPERRRGHVDRDSHIADPRSHGRRDRVSWPPPHRNPLRQNICPVSAPPVVVEFTAPPDTGLHELAFFLMPVAAGAGGRTRFFTTNLRVVAGA